MSSDAFVVGEDWISEHYFTTDAKARSFGARVTERRKGWDELADESVATPRSRFLGIRSDLSGVFATLAERKDSVTLRERVYAPLRDAIGFSGGDLSREISGPLTIVRPARIAEGASVALIEAIAVDQFDELLQKDQPTLLEPYESEPGDPHPLLSVPRLLSALFVDDDGPEFAIVLSGGWALLTDKERWPEGRYLAIDLQLVADRNHGAKGGELDRAVACLAAQSLLPNSEGTIWWKEVRDESLAHTVGVSQDLRDGVRRSIEIIANDVVATRRDQNLETLPKEQAQTLALQSLRYLYRILFLLFAEASPELEVVPANTPEYEAGYGLGRLRELVQVQLSHDAESRRHFYDSLAVLFSRVDSGHHAPASESTNDSLPEGLTFNALRADLFAPAAVALIDEVGLSDGALQRVLSHLLLSRQQGGRDRGYISYANLGINQLGAVYEGLMSYTGFFAETDLYEVAKEGDSSKGSWVVPVERSHGIDGQHFVQETDPVTGEQRAVLHPAGSFVYRLAGRERQQSASYYTPEVLTRFVVKQALEELLDQDGEITAASDILTMTVCEPALGSGAFAIEAVRQLADQYLTRRQAELGERIDPDAVPMELQRVKASIALHQVYGVDLNSTAVELAEISLWLDTMVTGLNAPWFGLHLRRGNSLIGARRAVYSRDQVMSKAWLKDVPRDVSVHELAENLDDGVLARATAGAVHHFLLPAEGWGSATEAKEAKELAPDALAALKLWRRSITGKPTKKQADQLVNLSYRVEVLWQLALRRLQIAETQVRRDIAVWGAEPSTTTAHTVTREEIEATLANADGAFQRLRRVMDAWNALWFWPLTETLTKGVQPPTLDEWIAGVTAVLGTHFEGKKASVAQGAVTLGPPTNWTDLGEAEEFDLAVSGALPIAQVVADSPWLRVAEAVAKQQGFFHWQLDFGTVFARGGFDLQVGNPPWVRPRSDVEALLAEGDPWWQLAVKPTQAQIAVKRAETLVFEGMTELLVDGTSDVAATAAFVGAPQNYPHLAGLQPDLYRCFMEKTWRHASARGATGLIHPGTHFTELKAGLLRSEAYSRLRQHWHFLNEKLLFEIDHKAAFGVNIYAKFRDRVRFDMASNIYAPDVVERSYAHDGTGEEPGVKDVQDNWDVRPHRNRIISVDEKTLRTWQAINEDVGVPPLQTRMVSSVNRATADVLAKLAAVPRLGALDFEYSAGWHEMSDRTKGYFDVEWGRVDSWGDAILQGPNFSIGNSFHKSPNATLLHNLDWTAIDLETLPPSAMPFTAYKLKGSRAKYDLAYTHWGPDKRPARDQFRVAWRSMAKIGNERALITTIVPPGATHVHAVMSGAGKSHDLLPVAGIFYSLISDFLIRAVNPSTINRGVVSLLPAPLGDERLIQAIALRVCRLTALTEDFAPLLRESFQTSWTLDGWSGGLAFAGRGRLGEIGIDWDLDFPLRRASDRRQALVEIDAIVALMLGVTADELCTIYRTQFAVLHGYDRKKYFYDANGRLVPNSVLTIWRKKGDAISAEERTATNASGNTYSYELPYVTLDREADMRQAYAHFESVLEQRS